MIPKGLLILLAAVAVVTLPAWTQAGSSAATERQHPAVTTPASPSPAERSPAVKAECNGGPCEDQQPRVIVTVPPAPPAPWLLRDQISWAANIVLAIVGYVGIMLAVSTLRKIERQTRAVETAASALADQAQATALSAQAVIEAERPWLLVTIEESLTVKDGFNIVAVNRGRSPAQIMSSLRETRIAVDEDQLPKTPEYGSDRPATPHFPVILVPGEATTIMSFSRGEAKTVSGTDAGLKKIEEWEEKIFLYGKIVYRSLVARSGTQNLETAWCAWYIHGRQKSGMVFAGPQEYNVHT